MWNERCSSLMPATTLLNPSHASGEPPTGVETKWAEWKCLKGSQLEIYDILGHFGGHFE